MCKDWPKGGGWVADGHCALIAFKPASTAFEKFCCRWESAHLTSCSHIFV